MADPRITRRTLIGGAAAGAAGAAVPGEALAARRRRRPRRRATPRKRKADVVVVGAGLAGLSAAREVVRAGRSAILLEARDRVGGRTLNAGIGDAKVVEVGGQWIGPTQDRMAALVKELGIDTYKTYNDGDNVFYRSGSVQRYSSSGPFGPVPPDATGAVEAQAAIVQLNEMALGVPRAEPWKAARAHEYDGQTFETWKLANTRTDGGRFLLDVAIEAVWAAEPTDISLLYVLFYIHSAGNETTPGTFERLLNTAGGAQESRIVGGSQLISLRMAEQLGRRIVLSSPVRKIVHGPRTVRVESDRAVVSAKQAILAIPPPLAARIDFRPALPAQRDQLHQRFPMGSVMKCMAVYPRPFWRAEGLTGQVVSDTGPVKIAFDNTPPDGSPGVLLGFIEGGDARAWTQRSNADRRAAVISNFTTYFGPQAANPTAYVEMNWATELWSRGCYGGYTPPGVLTHYGEAIRARFERVHWAGAETATTWNGYMDGAVSSGLRAARDALALV